LPGLYIKKFFWDQNWFDCNKTRSLEIQIGLGRTRLWRRLWSQLWWLWFISNFQLSIKIISFSSISWAYMRHIKWLHGMTHTSHSIPNIFSLCCFSFFWCFLFIEIFNIFVFNLLPRSHSNGIFFAKAFFVCCGRDYTQMSRLGWKSKENADCGLYLISLVDSFYFWRLLCMCDMRSTK
jgi:hypothetical protein